SSSRRRSPRETRSPSATASSLTRPCTLEEICTVRSGRTRPGARTHDSIGARLISSTRTLTESRLPARWMLATTKEASNRRMTVPIQNPRLRALITSPPPRPDDPDPPGADGSASQGELESGQCQVQVYLRIDQGNARSRELHLRVVPLEEGAPSTLIQSLLELNALLGEAHPLFRGPDALARVLDREQALAHVECGLELGLLHLELLGAPRRLGALDVSLGVESVEEGPGEARAEREAVSAIEVVG